MQGIERAYCDTCIRAFIEAWRELWDATAAETLRKTRYGKGDTLGLDAIPEIIIKSHLEAFDQHALLITEELDREVRGRWPIDADPVKQPLMFFCDPTDRSVQLKRFFEMLSKDEPTKKVRELFASCDSKKMWEETFEPPVEITGSTAAITCVRKGKIVFSVILNYISATLCVASDSGIFLFKLDDGNHEGITFSKILQEGRSLHFPGVRKSAFSLDQCRRFVTFLGKQGYRENFDDSLLFTEDAATFLHHKEPPGPPRALYLSELQKGYGPVGFIMANGEKIGEWMHWLAFVRYARNEDGGKALRAFEITLERPWTKNGMLMSTSPAYSMFCCDGDMYIDISRLRHFEHPSQFRVMLVVTPYDNERVLQILHQHQYREITECC